MEPLENPRENPCFGCGPGHARGLGLLFHRGEDDAGQAFVSTEHTPTGDEVGWPGFFHGGLHFTLLYETSYWAALELGPAVMTASGPLTFEEETVPRVGRKVQARGRLEPLEDGAYRVQAVSLGEDGRRLGTLEGTWVPARREAIQAAGIDLPAYLVDELAD